MKARIVSRNEIDTERWDDVISHSAAETLYPYAWYLDMAAENWSGLIADDYTFIMPLVWKRKIGFRYLYQPVYTQQLGVFSKEYVDPPVIREMLSVILKKFRLGRINFNARNMVGEEVPIEVDDQSNYILGLNGAYEKLYQSYSSTARQNILESGENGESVEKDVPVEEFIRLKKANNVDERYDENYQWLQQLLETIVARNAGSIYAFRTGKELTAAAFFAFSKTRAIYLVSDTGKAGEEHMGMFKIVDTFIRDHAGSELILDFKGSGIPSLARFFTGFGAQAEIYQSVIFSRFPTNLNMLR